MLTLAPLAAVRTTVALVLGARRTLTGSPPVWTVAVTAASAGSEPASSEPMAATTTAVALPALRRLCARVMAARVDQRRTQSVQRRCLRGATRVGTPWRGDGRAAAARPELRDGRGED